MGTRKKPTIQELQAILDDPNCGPIELLPDGSITVNEVITSLRNEVKQLWDLLVAVEKETGFRVHCTPMWQLVHAHLYPEPSPEIRVQVGGPRTIEESFLDEDTKPEAPLPWTHTVQFGGRVCGCRELPDGMWAVEGHGGHFGATVLRGPIPIGKPTG